MCFYTCIVLYLKYWQDQEFKPYNVKAVGMFSLMQIEHIFVFDTTKVVEGDPEVCDSLLALIHANLHLQTMSASKLKGPWEKVESSRLCGEVD
jgi:hypothetical protein